MVFDGTNLGIGNTPSGNGKLVVSNSGAEQFEFRPAYASNVNKLINYNRSGAAYVSEAHDAAQYYWETSGTEQMRLTSTGLGIGTSSPSQKLDVLSASATATVAKFGATNYGNLGTTYISIGTQYEDGTSRIGSVNPTGNQSQLTFEVNTSASGVWYEGMRLTSTGLKTKTTISVGDATPANNGAGITFPATQSASSDANTLDDYEEGTFTPTWTPSTSGTITLYTAYQNLAYTKVGRVVTITGQNAIQSVSSPVGTYVNITGLPFTVGATFVHSSGFLALDANSKLGVGAIAGNTSTTIELYVDASTLGTNSSHMFTFSYITAT